MPRADRVPFLPGRALATVPVEINGVREFLLIVDSGAERTLISPLTASRLGIDLSRPVRLEPLVGVGRTPPAPVVRLHRVQVGATRVTGLEASVFDLPSYFRADGLLGLNFLRRFRVTFEFDTRTLVLREPPPRRRTP